MRNHTPNDIRKITPKSSDTRQAVRPTRIQSKAALVDTNPERLETVGEDHIPVLAEGSAIDPSTSSRPANGQEASILHSFHHEAKAAGDSTSGSCKRKSPEQLERRRERRRRAQQIRRMIKSDKQSEEPIPRVFMQWEKSEVQRLLSKQELALQAAHQAELQKQELRLKSAHQAELQKQELRLKSAHQAELQKQEIRLKSAHRAELQRQEIRLKSAHQVNQFAAFRWGNQHETEDVMSMRYTCRIMTGDIESLSYLTYHLRSALLLLDNSVSFALEGLRKGKVLDSRTYEDLHCEYNLGSSIHDSAYLSINA